MTGLSGKVRTGRCWTDQNFSPSGSPKLAGDGLISEPDSAHWIFLKGQYWLLLAILAPRYHRNLDYVAYISISGELLVEEVGQVSLPESSNGTSSAFTSQGSLLCLLQGWISTCHPFALDECLYFLNSPWETFRQNLIDRRAARVGGRSPSPSRHRGGQLLHFPAWNTPRQFLHELFSTLDTFHHSHDNQGGPHANIPAGAAWERREEIPWLLHSLAHTSCKVPLSQYYHCLHPSSSPFSLFSSSLTVAPRGSPSSTVSHLDIYLFM